MEGALMTSVHEDAFTLLSGEDALSEYNWNTGTARHYFCSQCGIYPFRTKRAVPDHYGVNVNCLGGFEASALRLRQAEGIGMSARDAWARRLWAGPREA